MAKKLSETPGLDTPLNRGDTYRPDPPIEAFLAELRRMEDTPQYHFAWGTIVDIRLTVEKSGRATPGQRQAIQNIKAGSQRHEDRKGEWDRNARGRSRRYEGWMPGD